MDKGKMIPYLSVMKPIAAHISFLLLISFSNLLIAQNKVFSDEELLNQHAQTEVFRVEQDLKFNNEEKSPLVKDSIPNFTGLQYFDVDLRYVIPANFKVIEDGRQFEMKTTTSRLPVYRDYAEISFELFDSLYTLHAYMNVAFSEKSDYDSSLFVPFNDYTNGIESYGGGRYIDIKIPKGDQIILDFNRSYNPYCAYNDKYSCPIPPEENKLKLRIEAGVKKYH